MNLFLSGREHRFRHYGVFELILYVYISFNLGLALVIPALIEE